MKSNPDNELRRHAHSIARILTPTGGIDRPLIYFDLCRFIGIPSEEN